jgi:ankyrin repeat protein
MPVRIVKYEVDRRTYEGSFDERDTVSDVLRILSDAGYPNIGLELLDGDVPMDKDKLVAGLEESKIYKVEIRDRMPVPAPARNSVVVRPTALSVKCHRAVASGDLTGLRKLRAKAEMFNSLNENGLAPLHVAALRADAACVSLLLNLGANVDQRDSRGATPLFVAAHAGHVEVARVLLQRGASPSAPSVDGLTPSIVAARHGHVLVVRELSHFGCDMSESDVDRRTPMREAAKHGHVEVIRELSRLGVGADEIGSGGSTPLFYAADAGHVQAVQELVKLGASVHTKSENGAAILVLPARNGHVGVIRALAGFGADVNGPDGGITPLLAAAMSMRNQAVLELFRLGALVDKVVIGGRTPLMCVSVDGLSEMVRLLLGFRASAKQKSPSGLCSLVLAKAQSRVAVLSRLAGWR